MGKKFHVVTAGRKVGVFHSWIEAASYLKVPRRFGRVIHEGFDSLEEAHAVYNKALDDGNVWVPHRLTGEKRSVRRTKQRSQKHSPPRDRAGRFMRSTASTDTSTSTDDESSSMGSSPPTGITQLAPSRYSSDAQENPSTVLAKPSTRDLLTKSIQTGKCTSSEGGSGPNDRETSHDLASFALLHTPSTPKRHRSLQPASRSQEVTPKFTDVDSSTHINPTSSPASPSRALQVDELQQLLGQHVDLTPRSRRQRALQLSSLTHEQPNILGARDPFGGPLIRSIELAHIHMPDAGSLAFSDSDMVAYNSTRNSLPGESSDEFDGSSSQSSETWHTATESESESDSEPPNRSRFTVIRQEQAVNYTSRNEPRSLLDRHTSRITAVSRSASEPGPQQAASSNPLPPNVDRHSASFSGPGTSGLAALSLHREPARVYSPRVDPRSPVQNGSILVPNPFENSDIAYFGRPTPPQSFAVLDL